MDVLSCKFKSEDPLSGELRFYFDFGINLLRPYGFGRSFVL